MDIKKFTWDEDLLHIAGLDKNKLCELVPPGSAAGGLSEKAAKKTGLKRGLPVIICGGDQQNAAED
jgi:sugar (pentulose or hexulose) kinase